jgi:hypothetical protein
MKNKTVASVLVGSLFMVPSLMHAEDMGIDTLAHPVIAYDKHEVKASRNDIQTDETKLIEARTSMNERKAVTELNKADFEKALKGREARVEGRENRRKELTQVGGYENG